MQIASNNFLTALAGVFVLATTGLVACNKLGGKSNSSESAQSSANEPKTNTPPSTKTGSGLEIPKDMVGRWYSIEEKKWVTLTKDKLVRGPAAEDIFELIGSSDGGFTFERRSPAGCENCDPAKDAIKLKSLDGAMAQLTFQDNGEVVQNIIRYGIDHASLKGKLVQMGAGILGLNGLGLNAPSASYDINLQNPYDPSGVSVASISGDGTFQISDIKSGIYDLTVKEKDAAAPLYTIKGVAVDGAADDIGIITISSTEYNFKTEFLPQSDFLFDGVSYKAKLRVKNVGTVTVKGVNYQLSTSEPSVVLGDKKVGILNTIDPGQSVEVEVSFAISGMDFVEEKLVTIDVLLGDVTGTKWNDRSYIDIYKVPVLLNVSTLTSVSGLVIFKDRKLIPFSSTKENGAAVVSVPYIKNYPYKIMLSAATRAQEAVYSIGLKAPSAAAQTLEGFFDTASYEPNDLEPQATKVNLFDSIISYLHVGDLDGYTFSFSPIEIIYSGGPFADAKVAAFNGAYLPGQPLAISGNSANPMRPGFVFRGWNSKPSGQGDLHWPGDMIQAPWSDINLYAQWSGCDNGESCYSSISGLVNGTWAHTPSGKSLVFADGAWLDRSNQFRVLAPDGSDRLLISGANFEANYYSGVGSTRWKRLVSVTTPLGKEIQYSNGVWVERGSGTRVLAVDGTDNWAHQLNPDGRGYSSALIDKQNVAGRACPTNVFVPGNLVATGKCLYYDGGNPAQTLSASGTSQTDLTSLGLGDWQAAGTGNGTGASWYEGNIATCAAKGMRLPTLYETTAGYPTGSYKPSDASPVFSPSSGIPRSGGYTWTSSSSTHNSVDYWIWSGSSDNFTQSYLNNFAVRCVSPGEAAPYTVTYVGNDNTSGTVPVDANSYAGGSNVIISANTGAMAKSGYSLAGWTTSSDGSGTIYTSGQKLAVGTSNIALYAKWEPPYTVTYFGNGNTSGTVPVDANRYAGGSNVIISANTGALAKGGYLLAGWTTSSDVSGTSYTAGQALAVGAGNITLYAKWIETCGDTSANNCYSGTNATTLQAGVTLTTPSGKELQYSSGVWLERGSGGRVLASDGSDNWAYQLNPDGRSYSSSLLDKQHVAGRACPTNVFVPGNLVATGKCLYYDGGNPAQTLSASGTSQTDLTTLGLGDWQAAGTGNGIGASWYEGNITTCAAKGMRLPTLYETTAGDPGTYSNPSDASPVFSPSSGVPISGGAGNTWTSSAYTNSSSNKYWIWSASSTYNGNNLYYAVRCVVP
jgi:hypothetical protein